jgi:hypothetical protein
MHEQQGLPCAGAADGARGRILFSNSLLAARRLKVGAQRRHGAVVINDHPAPQRFGPAVRFASNRLTSSPALRGKAAKKSKEYFRHYPSNEQTVIINSALFKIQFQKHFQFSAETLKCMAILSAMLVYFFLRPAVSQVGRRQTLSAPRD